MNKKNNVNYPVFLTAAIIIILALTFTLIFKKDAEGIFSKTLNVMADNLDWFFVMTMNVILVFLFYIAFGKYGKNRIGGEGAKPEFKTTSWLAMLFTAGMGIGLLFFSVGEPIMHFNSIPPISSAQIVDSVRPTSAMKLTFLHWGLHAWGVYTLMGLALAYFAYSRKLPLAIRSVFFPFFGNKIYGWRGNVIDILAILATVFGLATSLGLGASQIGSGLKYVFNVSGGGEVELIIIAVVTLIAMFSAITGVNKGVKFLSEWNMRLALLLLAIVVVIGPTTFVFRAFIENTGNYVSNFIRLSSWVETFTGTNWQNSWTVFYWAWWIAWSPFVGMFIARISKGRTFKEFILGVLVVPSVFTFFWLSAFGSVALKEVIDGNKVIVDTINTDIATSLYVFFSDYPLSYVISIIVIILITGFFVTSSDSGSLVVSKLSTNSKGETPRWLHIFWSIAEGSVAAVLLIGGGLKALQTSTVIMGLPFGILLLLICYSLYKDFKIKKI